MSDEPEWKIKVAAQTARELRQRPTRSEAVLWKALRKRQLDGAKFRRQHRIEGFVVDFCCLEARLVVEIDGPIHDGTRAADKERQQLIEDTGFSVIRISTQVVEKDFPSALERIRSALDSAPEAPLPHAGEGWRQPG